MIPVSLTISVKVSWDDGTKKYYVWDTTAFANNKVRDLVCMTATNKDYSLLRQSS